VRVRTRSHADLGALAQIAADVHANDGYPFFLPSNLVGFIVDESALSGWVAEMDETLVGHVALHRRSSDPVMRLASAVLRKPEEQLAVVARLLVAPSARGVRVGRTLLATAANDAVGRGMTPILDVATRYTPAVTLYESAGWRRLGEVHVRFPEGEVHEYVYAALPAQDATARNR
jgi:GNAT superfamily N-acetyltransferase